MHPWQLSGKRICRNGIPVLRLSVPICADTSGISPVAYNSDAFECVTHGDILIVTPVRDFKSIREAELRDAYNEIYRQFMNNAVRNLIIDFTHVEYFGSTFVGVMIRLANKVRDVGGATVLCRMNDDIRGILKQLMLLEHPKTEFFWKRSDTRETAIQLLLQEAPSQPT